MCESGIGVSGLGEDGNKIAGVGDRRSAGGSLDTGLVRIGWVEIAEPVKPAAALREGKGGVTEPIKPAAVLAEERD